MKLKSLLYFFSLIVAAQVFFACSTAKYYDFGSRGAYGTQSKTETAVATTQPAGQTEAIAETAPAEASVAETTPTMLPAPYLQVEKPATEPVKTPAEAAKPLSKTERKQVVKQLKQELKAMKKAQKQANAPAQPAVVSTLLLVILAILLPPLAVFLVDGIGTTFWISLLLTLLFWLPGVIYALYIIFSR